MKPNESRAYLRQEAETLKAEVRALVNRAIDRRYDAGCLALHPTLTTLNGEILAAESATPSQWRKVEKVFVQQEIDRIADAIALMAGLTMTRGWFAQQQLKRSKRK